MGGGGRSVGGVRWGVGEGGGGGCVLQGMHARRPDVLGRKCRRKPCLIPLTALPAKADTRPAASDSNVEFTVTPGHTDAVVFSHSGYGAGLEALKW